MGASMVPLVGSGWPWTSVWYRLSTVRSLNCRLSEVYARSDLATTISPEVPTSRRCTMPWRSAAPEVEMRYPAAASPPITVVPVQPGLGCAATPTGLTITTMSSSSWTISMPWTGAATICTGSAACGISTSSQAPPCTRSDFPTTDPSTVTFPAAAISAALVREKPNMREMAASTRSPSRPSGTGRVRISGTVLTRRVCRTPPTAPTGACGSVLVDRAVGVESLERQQHDQDAAAHDRRVGEVEDGEVLGRDEVDDRALEHARGAEDAVGEVAERAAEQQTERDRPGQAVELAGEPGDDHDHGRRDHREDHGEGLTEAEGRARVADRLELQPVPDDLDRLVVLQPGDHDHLADQVEGVREGGHREQHGDTAPAPRQRRLVLLRFGPRRLWGIRRTDDALRLCHVSPST